MEVNWLFMGPPTILAVVAWLEIRRYNHALEVIRGLVSSHLTKLTVDFHEAEAKIVALTAELHAAEHEIRALTTELHVTERELSLMTTQVHQLQARP